MRYNARLYWRETLIAYYLRPLLAHYDEYLRLGYGIGSGAVESAQKRWSMPGCGGAGMRWSEAGARRLSALRLLLLNERWRVPGGCPVPQHGF